MRSSYVASSGSVHMESKAQTLLRWGGPCKTVRLRRGWNRGTISCLGRLQPSGKPHHCDIQHGCCPDSPWIDFIPAGYACGRGAGRCSPIYGCSPHSTDHVQVVYDVCQVWEECLRCVSVCDDGPPRRCWVRQGVHDGQDNGMQSLGPVSHLCACCGSVL